MSESEAEKRLAEIVALCQRYDHPGVNPETHALARKVLVIAGERGESK